jgi:two-component system, LytTR family, sensor kinase
MHSDPESRRDRILRWLPAMLLFYAVAASTIGAAWFSTGYTFRSSPSFFSLLVWQGGGYAVWGFLVVPLFGVIARRARSIGRAIIYVVILLIPIVLIVSPLISWWLNVAHPDAPFRPPSTFRLTAERLFLDILLGSFAAAAVLAYEAIRRAGNESAARVAAERETERARLQMVKSQLRPHFLFNTLHTISALIEVDPARAQQMLHDLSSLLRLTLERHEVQMTTLKQELELVRLYLSIQKVRLGDRLVVREEIGEGLESFPIPDLLLQPIVENAVMHGIAPRSRGGTVTLRASRGPEVLQLEVRDDGPGPGGEVTEGVGLSNTRARLEHLYRGHASLTMRREGNETLVRIILPLEQR